jgi:hypothetical protein
MVLLLLIPRLLPVAPVLVVSVVMAKLSGMAVVW